MNDAIRKKAPGGASFSLQTFLACVVGLNRLGDDGAGGVSVLEVLALRGDGPRHVAGTQSEGYRQTGQQSRHGSRYDLVNLLLTHTSPT